MNFPKLVIASNGEQTAVLLDGIFIGSGIERLDFSTENEAGEMKSTIRIMDLDVRRASLEPNTEKFSEFLEKTAGTGETSKILERFKGVAYMKEDSTVNLSVKIDASEMDDVTRKAERLNALLEEASSIVNELASREINLSVNVKD